MSKKTVMPKAPVLSPEETLADACFMHCVKVSLTPAEALILVRCLRYGAAAVSKEERENGAAASIATVCNNLISELTDSLVDSMFSSKKSTPASNE